MSTSPPGKSFSKEVRGVDQMAQFQNRLTSAIAAIEDDVQRSEIGTLSRSVS